MTHITCPSGLSGTIRGLKVSEERILADRNLARDGGQMDALLRVCWLETTCSGPYDFGDKNIDWEQVLVGDRFFTLLQIRAATYGPEYGFNVSCQNDNCRHVIEWEVGLDELPLRELSEASRATLTRDNRFETALPDTRTKIWFKLMTGADERRLPQLRRNAPDRMLSTALLLRVQEIEGIASQDKRKFLEDMSMRDANFLLRAFDEVDCGVETAITIECPMCFTGQEVDLPLGPGFLMPRHRSSFRKSISKAGEKPTSSSLGSSTEAQD